MGLQGQLVGDRYRMGACIGRGAYGEVYQAMQEPLGRRVAVKVMRCDIPMNDYSLAAERFHHEASVTANLQHPNIVTLYDYGRTNEGRPYMAMEFVSGISLKQVFEQAPLGIERACTLMRDLLAGLGAAHRAGLIHRDLKPANVLAGRDCWGRETVKILDFGLSVFGQRTGSGPHCFAMGSLGYMSPEQCAGRSVDARSDLYAVGVMLFEALMGRPPFDCGSIRDWLHAHQVQEAPPLPGVSVLLQSIVHQAMAKDPTHRFSSAFEMRLALEANDTGTRQQSG